MDYRQHETLLSDFFNKHFQTKEELLSKGPSLLEKLKNEIANHEFKLSFESCSEYTKFQVDSQNQIAETVAVLEQYEVLEKEYTEKKQKYMKLQEKYLPVLQKIKRIEERIELEKHISELEEVESYIVSSLCLNDLDLASDYFFQLAQLALHHKKSQRELCYAKAKELLLSSFKDIADVNRRNFQSVLKDVNWPFLTTSQGRTLDSLTFRSDAAQDFLTCFVRMSRLSLPAGLSDLQEDLGPQDGQSTTVLLQRIYPDWTPLPLPMDEMLVEIKKRFYFNFYGSRKTNRLDKPEWYLSHVLTLVKDNQDFLTGMAQQCVDKMCESETAFPYYNCLHTFIRGLVALIVEKMQVSLPQLVSEHLLFCHLVDEVLHFESLLRRVFHYPASELWPMDLLLQEDWFEPWLALERKNASTKLDAIMSSHDAWRHLTEDAKHPECSDSFLALVHSICEVARHFRLRQRRAQFVALVNELLANFHLRLTQILNRSATSSALAWESSAVTGLGDSLLERHCGIANAFYYVKCTIELWTDDEMFYELYADENLREICRPDSTNQGSLLGSSFLSDPVTISSRKDDNNVVDNGALSASLSSSFAAAKWGDALALDFTPLECGPAVVESVFGESVQIYAHQCRRILQRCLKQVMSTLRSFARPYRATTRWILGHNQGPAHLLTASRDLSVSPEAYGLLSTLRDQLYQMQSHFSEPLFHIAWRNLAIELDSFIFNKVIMEKHFDLAGGQQMQVDIASNLVALFRPFTAHPEHHFRKSLEACRLLTLTEGGFQLLMDLMHRGLYGTTISGVSSKPTEDPIAALKDIGVIHLGPDEAWKVLQLRIVTN